MLLYRLKLHRFDLLWICCRHFDLLYKKYNKSTTNPQQIEPMESER